MVHEINILDHLAASCKLSWLFHLPGAAQVAELLVDWLCGAGYDMAVMRRRR